jgi:hypothetical protein
MSEDNIITLHNQRGEMNLRQINAMDSYLIGALSVHVDRETWSRLVTEAADWAMESYPC